MAADPIAAHRRGHEVHVWTVDDPQAMERYLARGVDAIITGRPDVLARVRARRLAMSDPERLILASRALLGLDWTGDDADER